ncbi:MAG TPA: DNA polymerase III subunit delta', partial [Xanthobacteraceae bacterium]
LRPLANNDVARAVAAAVGRDASDAQIRAAADAAEGSVRRALALLDRDALDLRDCILAQLERLPSLDPPALHALGDRLYGTEPASLAAFVDTVNGWLASRVERGPQQPAMLNRLAATWEMFNRAARDVETFNLDRKPLVFNVFGWLADACRG